MWVVVKQVKYLPEQLSRVHDKLAKKKKKNCEQTVKAVTHVEEGNTFHKNESSLVPRPSSCGKK